jgi:hypothetical protein
VSCGTAFGQSVSDFFPSLGAPGEAVTILGNGFANPVEVRFGGVRDMTAQATTTMQIQARVPSGAVSGQISVKVGTGDPVSSLNDFTVIGPGPYVTGFSPGSGGANITVAIGGVHFTNPVTVKFNGVTSPSAAATTFNQINATTPNGVTTGPITVTTAAGSYTTVTNFFVPPSVTGRLPANGRAGTNVVLTGNNFSNAIAVRFHGTNGVSMLNGTFNVISNGALQVTVPAGATNGFIRVDAPAGSANSATFVVQPTVFGFSPAFGPIGSSVTITGANFNVGTPVVRFNGVQATTVSNVSFGQLTAVVPNTTTGPVTLSTADGTNTSAQLFYLPASITGFTPNSTAPGTRITITGNNFSNASSVTFNGAAASFTVTNNTTIGVTVPADVTTGPISVTTPAGTTNSPGLFYAAPVITSFLPTHGLPGTNVTILGTNFLGATAVKFNGLDAQTFSVTDNGTIQATVPTGASTGPITVIAPAGTNVSSSNFVLDYTSDLSVTISDSPDPVLVTSNLTYTITVANNGPFPAPNVVLSDTLPASVILKFATATQGTLVTNGNPIIANLGTIASGASANVSLIVAPQAIGMITNSANVTNDYTDPVSGNNTATATTTVFPLPILSIELLSADRVRLSWPLPLSNYVLQFKTVLAITNTWQNVTSPPQMTVNENFVIETNTAASRFYRLRN